MTDHLVAWLRGVLDEDERRIYDGWDSDGRARVATMWTGGEPGYTTVASDHADDYWVADGREVTDARHVRVLWDPASVLADIEAKRAIIDLHACSCPDPECRDCGECSGAHHADPTPAPCQSLRLLASAYRDRPGYRQEWAPDKD